MGLKLAQRLEQEGREVVTVRAGEYFAKTGERAYVIDPRRRGDYDSLLEDLRRSNLSPQRILHLWSITPEDDTRESVEDSLERVQNLGFYSLLFLAQAQGKQKADESVRFTVLSNNMQAVTGEEALWPEKATVLGPCRVIPQEYSNLTCRSIDITLPAAGTLHEERMIEQLLTEISTHSAEPLVAYRGGHRWVPQLDAVRLEPPGEETPRLRNEGVYLITGGLGAIGLTLAEYMARAVRAKLILVGRSAFPEKGSWDAWLRTHADDDAVSAKIRKLRSLEEHGAEVLVFSADVAEREQMRKVIDQTLLRFKQIHGVIHAAGVPGIGMTQLKSFETAAAVLAPKVSGTLVLDELLKDSELDFLVFCSSTASVVGGVGAVDYCAANAFLDRYAQYKTSKHGVFAVSVGWPRWEGIGMAVETNARARAGAARRRVETGAVKHPLLGSYVDEKFDEEVYATELNEREHWVLSEHRIRGNAVLPGTAYLEMARAAFKQRDPHGAIEIREATFVTPLIVRSDEAREVRITVRKNGDTHEFVIESKSGSNNGHAAQWERHAIGKIDAVAVGRAVGRDLKELIAACETQGTIIPDEYQYKELGPRWHNLSKVWLGANEGVAALELGEQFSGDLEQYELHPALLDMATGFLSGQFAGEGDYLPLRYRRLTIKAPLSRKIYSHVKYKENGSTSKETMTFDIVIADENGIELVEIEDFTMRRVGDVRAKLRASVGTATSDEPAASERGLGAQTEPGERSEESLEPRHGSANVAGEGILPAQGVDAFKRILFNGASPLIFVSKQDLPALVERFSTLKATSIMPELDKARPSRAAHPRPNLGVAYVAPRSEVEQTIAAVWQEILGIEEVGIEDNFFDLGGDSLIALQLSSRLRDAFQVEPSLGGLFESPTVAGLAVLIAQSLAAQMDEGALERMLAELEQ
jgi:polyketide synthase PksJ